MIRDDQNEFCTGPCFLTITMDNHGQHNDLLPKNRLKRVRTDFHEYVKPLLDSSFRDYDCRLEISHAMSSRGKYFPRLHYHVLGHILDPIELQLGLGYLCSKYYGYDIWCNIKQKMWDEKQTYISKQHSHWEIYMRRHNLLSHNIKCVNASPELKATGKGTPSGSKKKA